MNTPGRVPAMTTQVRGQAMRPSLKYRYTPLGMATMLYTKFVELTAGLVKPRTLIWNGRRMKAPDTPAMEVKAETISATRGGMNIQVFTPETGKRAINMSITNVSIPQKASEEGQISEGIRPRHVFGTGT